jgi:hypothetical protein
MTILKEERLVAGDPGYDPSKSDDEQSLKAQIKFTDEMFNMKQLVAGKLAIRHITEVDVSAIDTSGNVTVPTNHGISLGDSVTISGANENEYNITATVSQSDAQQITIPLGSTPSGSATATPDGMKLTFSKKVGTDHEKVSGLYFKHLSSDIENDASKTVDEKKQLKDVVSIQTRKLATGTDHSKIDVEPRKYSMEMFDSTDAKRVSLNILPYKEELKFSDDSKFVVDNSIKSLCTDMSTLEFGKTYDGSGSLLKSHRLCVKNDKLYIQKYNGTSWVGADIVLDAISSYTSSITITATNTTAGKINVTATVTGTYHHWHVKVDDGTEYHVTSGLTYEIDSPYIGKHKVIAHAVDESHVQLSEFAIFDIVTTI